jgi:SPP1 gp7 family putative phage head morphogenesis protein
LTSITFDFGLESLKEGVKDMKEVYELERDWSLENSGAIQVLEQSAGKVGEDATNTITERIRQIIANDLQEDKTSLSKIRDDIEGMIDDEEEWRTDRIARTELINAYSEGSMAAYKNSGVVDHVKWMTSDDDACPICEANEDEGVISVSENFESGDGEPPAHPNCRCCVVPVFD